MSAIGNRLRVLEREKQQTAKSFHVVHVHADWSEAEQEAELDRSLAAKGLTRRDALSVMIVRFSQTPHMTGAVA